MWSANIEAIKRYTTGANDGSITEDHAGRQSEDSYWFLNTLKEGDDLDVSSPVKSPKKGESNIGRMKTKKRKKDGFLCMELAHKYVYLYNERIVIYIDTPWIQQMMYASMKMDGLYTLTVRSTDKQGFKIEAFQLFTDKTSRAQILVANINIMATGVNLHDACRVGVIASQHFNPKTNLQIHRRLNCLGQKHAVIWHCSKVKDSFHDHQDRVMLTKWARQLFAESNIQSWLSGALMEMALFEIMKTYADLVDSNVFMVNTRGIDFEVDTTYLIAGLMILSHYIPIQWQVQQTGWPHHHQPGHLQAPRDLPCFQLRASFSFGKQHNYFAQPHFA